MSIEGLNTDLDLRYTIHPLGDVQSILKLSFIASMFFYTSYFYVYKQSIFPSAVWEGANFQEKHVYIYTYILSIMDWPSQTGGKCFDSKYRCHTRTSSHQFDYFWFNNGWAWWVPQVAGGWVIWKLFVLNVQVLILSSKTNLHVISMKYKKHSEC